MRILILIALTSLCGSGQSYAQPMPAASSPRMEMTQTRGLRQKQACLRSLGVADSTFNNLDELGLTNLISARLDALRTTLPRLWTPARQRSVWPNLPNVTPAMPPLTVVTGDNVASRVGDDMDPAVARFYSALSEGPAARGAGQTVNACNAQEMNWTQCPASRPAFSVLRGDRLIACRLAAIHDLLKSNSYCETGAPPDLVHINWLRRLGFRPPDGASSPECRPAPTVAAPSGAGAGAAPPPNAGATESIGDDL